MSLVIQEEISNLASNIKQTSESVVKMTDKKAHRRMYQD